MALPPEALLRVLLQPIATQLSVAIAAMPDGAAVTFHLEDDKLSFRIHVPPVPVALAGNGSAHDHESADATHDGATVAPRRTGKRRPTYAGGPEE